MNVKVESNRPFTVIVEGNIGSGKTTFLEYFNKYKNVCVLAEPIEMWRNCNGHNLLVSYILLLITFRELAALQGHLYEDPKKWCFSFQSYVQLTMLQQHLKPTNCPIKLMERSIFSAKYTPTPTGNVCCTTKFVDIASWKRWLETD